jgi:hypothetical protein
MSSTWTRLINLWLFFQTPQRVQDKVIDTRMLHLIIRPRTFGIRHQKKNFFFPKKLFTSRMEPITKYISGPPAEKARLATANIHSVSDLFYALDDKVSRKTRPHRENLHIHYIRHIYSFLRNISEGLMLNWELMKDQRLIKLEGRGRDAWCGMIERGYHPNGKAPETPATQRMSRSLRLPPLDSRSRRLIEYNGSRDEEFDLLEALKASEKSALKEEECRIAFDKLQMEREMEENLQRLKEDALSRFSIELCCPISLQPFTDPVQTIRGQTYERKEIEKWFKAQQTQQLETKPDGLAIFTDPITNDILPSTELYADDAIKKKCEEEFEKLMRITGRGGRGRGGRGGRGRGR